MTSYSEEIKRQAWEAAQIPDNVITMVLNITPDADPVVVRSLYRIDHNNNVLFWPNYNIFTPTGWIIEAAASGYRAVHNYSANATAHTGDIVFGAA